jgi:C4-dicarboxylate-specific signal transduction histidine kinase
LGLAIMVNLAHNLGGRLQIKNQPGGLRVRYSQPAVS